MEVAPSGRRRFLAGSDQGEDADRGVPAHLKILHTSDVHLDSRFVGIADLGVRARRRREHRDVIARIIDLAEKEDVDLLLFVGDLFDESTYQFETISFLVEEFRRIHPKPVFIAPGLSDSSHPQSPYLIFDWGENVHIFSKPTYRSVTVASLGVTVHGIAPGRDHLDTNPLGGLLAPDDDMTHIGMAYGSCLDIDLEDGDRPFPFHEEDVKETGVRYMALGGYHSYRKIGKTPVACYPGMPEGTGFNTLGEKVVVLAKVGDRKTSISRRSVEGVVFEEVMVDLGGISSTDGLIRAVRDAVSAKGRGNLVIRVRLVGDPESSLVIDVTDLLHRVSLERGHLEILDETRMVPDWRNIGKRPTLAGEFARSIQEKVDRKESARHEKVRDYGLSALLGKRGLRLRKPPPS